MEFNIKNMYRYLISHTFPGFLFLLELLYFIKIIKPNLWFFFTSLWTGNTGNTIAIVIIFYAISTLLGFIIDVIHHFLYEDIEDLEDFKDFLCLRIKESKYKNEMSKDYFQAISKLDDLEIYQHLVMDDYWYPYEACGNLSIVMVPGFFVVVIWFFKISWFYSLWTGILAVFILLLYISIFWIMIFEAKLIFKQFKNGDEKFIEAKNN